MNKTVRCLSFIICLSGTAASMDMDSDWVQLLTCFFPDFYSADTWTNRSRSVLMDQHAELAQTGLPVWRCPNNHCKKGANFSSVDALVNHMMACHAEIACVLCHDSVPLDTFNLHVGSKHVGRYDESHLEQSIEQEKLRLKNYVMTQMYTIN
jgi:hypothetical protein